MRLAAAAVAFVLLLTGCTKDPEAQTPGRTPSSGPSSASPAAPTELRVVSETAVGTRLVDLTIESPAVGRAVKVRLLTPDGWAQRGTKTWPVLYLLHGCCDVYSRWSTETDIARTPELRNVLVVMPEGGAVGYYSDWFNGGRGGAPKWETFHLRELLPLLQSRYGGGTKRAVAGLSMGGLGALLYTARNPGTFGAAASFSGVVHPLFEGFYNGLSASMVSYSEDPLQLWGDPVEQRANWEQHDPYYLTAKLRSVPLFLSSGDGRPGPLDKTSTTDPNEQFLGRMNRATAAQFTKAGLNLRTDFYGPGTHNWPYWQREFHKALPMLMTALE